MDEYKIPFFKALSRVNAFIIFGLSLKRVELSAYSLQPKRQHFYADEFQRRVNAFIIFGLTKQFKDDDDDSSESWTFSLFVITKKTTVQQRGRTWAARVHFKIRPGFNNFAVWRVLNAQLTWSTLSLFFSLFSAAHHAKGVPSLLWNSWPSMNCSLTGSSDRPEFFWLGNLLWNSWPTQPTNAGSRAFKSKWRAWKIRSFLEFKAGKLIALLPRRRASLKYTPRFLAFKAGEIVALLPRRRAWNVRSFLEFKAGELIALLPPRRAT